MQSNSQDQNKKLKDFEKYARFICENFDINIVLDATRAETDGKVIYLPNVMSMTSKELDMMYAILLHEAGHIRYSTFDESYFNSLKSVAHAFLANAIEDARIENLLMKDFGGAKYMFENLYCNHTQDKNLMKKVFKHDGQKPDLFTTLAFYAHNKIVQFETASLKDIAGAYRSARITKFWRENNLDKLIAKTPLKAPRDVLNLTNEIYALFAKSFKDKTKKLDLKADLKQKADIAKQLDDLAKEALKVESLVSDLKVKIEESREKLESYDKIERVKAEHLKNQMNETNQKIFEINEQIKFKEKYDKKIIDVNRSNCTIEKNKADIQKFQEEIKTFEEKLQKGVTGRVQSPKEMTNKQTQSLRDKILSKKEQLAKASKKIASTQEELIDLKKKVADDDSLDQQTPSKYNKNLDIEAKKAEEKELAEEAKKIREKFDKIYTERAKFVTEIQKHISELESTQTSFMEKATTIMVEMDKNSGSEFDLEILPEIHYEEVWPEAANVQEKFDKKATSATGKMVRNGEKVAGLLGTNIRDVITFIDKAKIKVNEIDVTELFKGKIGVSKLEDFNSQAKSKNHMDDKSVLGVFGTYREHIPLTTMYDSFKKENMKHDKKEKTAMLQKNNLFYRDLKKVFSKKFKFAKKDFWKGNQEDGNLDVRNLWRLPTNQGDDYYEVSKPKFINKTAATILVDLSGSQSKEATDFGEKIKELVLGISVALDEVHIKHEILGFHAPLCEEMREAEADIIYTRRSNRLETILYKDSAQKDNNGIMNIETKMSDNSDGESLRIAIKRLKAIKAKSHLMFVISDGKPFLSDTDISVLDEDLRGALRLAMKEKIQMVGIGYFNELEHFFGNRFCNATKNEDIIKFFDRVNFQL